MDLSYRTVGEGPPILIIHGGAEDVLMHVPLAHAIAGRGHRVIWYDRRGTGGSTRDDWPGGGADQHADDAAALLRDLDAVPATAVGFSSGAVVALALAARHPQVVREVIAWEPATVGMLDGADEALARVNGPHERHLLEHPSDWIGAYRTWLTTVSQGRADLCSPLVKQAERNAEAILRDDGRFVVRRSFTPGELPADKVVLAVSENPDPLHRAIIERFAELLGQAPVTVVGAREHEAYLTGPDPVADFVAGIAQRPPVVRDDLPVRVEVIGRDCPVLPGVTVGVQRRSEVVDEQPADGGPRTWVFEVEVMDGDFRGPYVHGRRGARFVYLSWQAAGSGRFRRAKLMLDAVPADILREALGQALRADVSLTMPDGSPLCAAVRPPAVAWSAVAPGGPTDALAEQ